MAMYRPEPLPEMDREWQKLKTRLNLENTRVPSAIVTSRHRRRHEAWVRFGAVAFVVILLSIFIFRTKVLQNWTARTDQAEFQEVSTGFGQRATITLPDATIILNANSTLRYPTNWSATATRQFDVNGEVYFNVVKQTRTPINMLVQTRDGIMTVVGTRFAVYERGKGTRVVVEKGAVEVSCSAGETDTKVLLQSDHLLQFQKGDQKLEPHRVNVAPYVTWWQEQLKFEQTPFREIAQRLEETYGIQVEVKDQRLLQRTLSGSIENQNLAVVISALAEALRVPVEHKGPSIIFGNPSRSNPN